MRVYKQILEPTCGPKSVQTALAYYGIYPSFSEIKQVCGTDSVGTLLTKITEAVKYFGLYTELYVDREVSIDVVTNRLDKHVLVMIHWYIGINENGDHATHVALAYHHDDSHLYLADTSSHLYTEPYIKMKKSMLKKCWDKHPEVKWLLVMYK